MAPVFLSDEWNRTCALRPATPRVDALVAPGYFVVDIVLLTLVCLLIVVTLVSFKYGTSRYSYIRKRSFLVLTGESMGLMFQLSAGLVRDLYGRQEFSCVAVLWLRVLSLIFLTGPIMVKLTSFQDQLDLSKALSTISLKKLHELANDAVAKEKRKSVFTKSMRVATKLDDESSRDGISDSQRHLGSSAATSFDEGMFTKALYKRSLQYKLFVLTVPFTPVIATCLALQFSLPYFNSECVGCYEEIVIKCVVLGVLSIIVTALLWSVRRLRVAADPLNVLSDLKIGVIVGAVIGIPGVIGFAVDEYIQFPYELGLFSWDWLIIIAASSFYAIVFLKPVYVAYRSSQKVMSRKIDFKTLIGNIQFQKLFAEHLITEWAIENLRFYNQINSFKSHYATFSSAKELNNVAVEIYDFFIRTGSVMEVNISAPQRDRLDRAFQTINQDRSAEKAPRDIFDEAQAEILVLMQKDSFAHFQLTKTFQEFSNANLVLNPTTGMIVVAVDAQ